VRWTVPLIAGALVAKDVAGAPRIRDPLMSLVDLLPGWLVDAGYEAIARGLHIGIAAAAALMLATSLAVAVALRRRPHDIGQHADPAHRFAHAATPRCSAESPQRRVALPHVRA
jgi:hypothetical protein